MASERKKLVKLHAQHLLEPTAKRPSSFPFSLLLINGKRKCGGGGVAGGGWGVGLSVMSGPAVDVPNALSPEIHRGRDCSAGADVIKKCEDPGVGEAGCGCVAQAEFELTIFLPLFSLPGKEWKEL